MNLERQNAFIARVGAVRADAGVVLASEFDKPAVGLLLRLWHTPYVDADAEGFTRALTRDLTRLTDRPDVYDFVASVVREAYPQVAGLLADAGFDPHDRDHCAAMNRMAHRVVCAHYVGARLGVARDVAGSWAAGVKLVETVLEPFSADDDLRLTRDYLHLLATAWDQIDPDGPFTPEVTEGLGEMAVSELGVLLMIPNPEPLEFKRRAAQVEEKARRFKRLGEDMDRGQDMRWRRQLNGHKLLPIGDWDAPVENDPAKVVATDELNALVRSALTPDEARVLGARADGVGWSAIARRLGMSRKVAKRVAAQGERKLREQRARIL